MKMDHQDRHTPLSENYLRMHTIGELKPLSAPILLVAYDPTWPDRFEHEAERIRRALGEQTLRIEHVGSTSVPGLPAKPIVDILLVVADSAKETEYVTVLEGAGYKLRVREPGWYEHRIVQTSGDGVHSSLVPVGLPRSGPILEFREWLRTNEADRELYARSK